MRLSILQPSCGRSDALGMPREGVGRLGGGRSVGQLNKSYFPEQLRISWPQGHNGSQSAEPARRPAISNETPRKAITQIQEIRAVIGFDSRRQIDYPHKGSAGHSPLSSLKGPGANPARISDATDLALYHPGKSHDDNAPMPGVSPHQNLLSGAYHIQDGNHPWSDPPEFDP